MRSSSLFCLRSSRWSETTLRRVPKKEKGARCCSLLSGALAFGLRYVQEAPRGLIWLTRLQMSAPMILGVRSLNLSIRTTLPAIGLLFVIIIVFLAKDRLFESVDEIPQITLGSPPTRHYRLSDMVRNNRRSTRMAAFQEPPTRYSDAKQGETTTQTEVTPPHSRSHSRSHSRGQSRELPAISGPAPGQSERELVEGGTKRDGDLTSRRCLIIQGNEIDDGPKSG